MTSNELAALILPYAKEHHPEKYTDALRVAHQPEKFRRYLIRLVEIRIGEYPAWMNELPISVLDETSLTIRVRDRTTGQEIPLKGQRAEKPISHRIAELALDKTTFDHLQRAKVHLDLEYVDG
jgi:hypothetical protein